MTPDQLQAVFQVDSFHDVPHYNLVTLSHHGSAHRVSRRDTTANQLQQPSNSAAEPQHSSHKKHDLSKSSYYSASKKQSAITTQHQYLDVRLLAEHNVSLSAFGDTYNLTLRPTQGLFKEGTQSLRMWTVTSEPNATDGLEYRPVLEVSRIGYAPDVQLRFLKLHVKVFGLTLQLCVVATSAFRFGNYMVYILRTSTAQLFCQSASSSS